MPDFSHGFFSFGDTISQTPFHGSAGFFLSVHFNGAIQCLTRAIAFGPFHRPRRAKAKGDLGHLRHGIDLGRTSPQRGSRCRHLVRVRDNASVTSPVTKRIRWIPLILVESCTRLALRRRRRWLRTACPASGVRGTRGRASLRLGSGRPIFQHHGLQPAAGAARRLGHEGGKRARARGKMRRSDMELSDMV